MLSRLSIRNVVLIEKLDLDFAQGLSVLTGETGAGKSILLDSLGLALGSRAEARLVRHGTDQAMVTAEFNLNSDHPAFMILKEHGLDLDGEALIVRRQLSADGRSRAFINDQTVSVGLLREIGDEIVEIHGQFDNHRLLNPATHVGLLDTHGGHGALLKSVKAAHKTWREAAAERKRAEDALHAARQDEEFLRHAVEELRTFNPQEGEEESLAQERQMLMHGEKLIDAMNAASKALDGGKGVERLLRNSIRALEPVIEKADGILDTSLKALDQAAEYVALGLQELNQAANRVDLDPRHLEQVEERLFALRALARKHNVDITALAGLFEDLSRQLAEIDDGGEHLDALAHAETQARGAYGETAAKLSQARKHAAQGLDQAVCNELGPLRLGSADFSTRITALDEESTWGASGWDRVAFEIATNPGAPAGPLNKIASGGELSRFMLALKVVLAQSDHIPTLIFDEVDSGIGGQVADAVGQRLAKLGEDVQLLVVTHSPQVAARGQTHWHISKAESDGSVRTSMRVLDIEQRSNEIARMLSGETLTDQARAAAASLLIGAAP
ncbi:MAG: DNA repair protein RecN [Rhodospirillaceae bacterium]|nr:MAG: DNA repair protein RecN [Rhodospirillaceae bacterium]